MSSGVRAFILTARGDLTGAETAGIFIKALPRIKKLATKNRGPFIAPIQRDSAVEIMRI